MVGLLGLDVLMYRLGLEAQLNFEASNISGLEAKWLFIIKASSHDDLKASKGFEAFQSSMPCGLKAFN